MIESGVQTMLAHLALVLSLLLQADAGPLPDLDSFLREFRNTLHTDNVLLSQYTYTERRTHIDVDSDGREEKKDAFVYQVTRGSDSGALYRTLLSKNGKPVQGAKPEKIRRSGRRDDEKVIEDVFGVYEFKMIGRENVDGRPTIRLRFTPRADYKPITRQGGYLKRAAGEAWVDEADHELARIDAQLIGDISIGFGLVAKLRKGTRIQAERRKINSEVWLPAATQFSLSARVLLFKSYNFREVSEYSDYKKFNVETILDFPGNPRQ